MPRKAAAPAVDPLQEEGSLTATQTGAEEEIDREMDKYSRMMNDCAGVTDGEIVFWLHRANEKNKSLHATYLKRYPKETSFAEIFDEARDQYGAGDYVLLAKKDEVMFRKMAFSTEKPKEPEKAVVEPKVDPMDRLSVAMERLTVVDKVGRIINDAREKPGTDPMVGVLTVMLTGMQQQNTEMLKIMMQQKQAPAQGGNESLLDAIKLGVSISGGKVPMEEGEGGFMEILSSLKPYVPQIISFLTARQPAVPGARPVPGRPGVVVPRPLPVSAGAPPVLPPPETAVPPVEDARTVIMRRVVDEIKFVLTLPITPKAREHVINYIESYLPDVLQQAEIVNAEMFAAYAVTLDPAFAGQENFFMDLHRQYMSSLDQEPSGELMDGSPANPVPPGEPQAS
jgi:hypothetical protein